jgi:fatty acid desaturase
VLGSAVVLIGALQHRLAGLGHEASHYTLLRNKLWNDVVGDVFCMFPILSTIHFYRVFHLAHHQYTNDPGRDPDLVALGDSKMVERFPMGRWEFVKRFYLRVITDPRSFLRYQWDYIQINVLGSAENVYLRPKKGKSAAGEGVAWPRLGAVLGLVYLGAVIAFQWVITTSGRPWMLWVEGLIGTLLVIAACGLLPASAFFPTPFRQAYSSRVAGALRLSFYTGLLVALGFLRVATSGRSSVYFFGLWIVPMMTSFSFFMLLRDVYQHTNADNGRLTHSRVFFADPFSRWAVFVYGQDMHIPHHLFPVVPHYHLPALHRLLKSRHADYAAQVVECHGTFANNLGLPTILDTLSESRPRRLASEHGAAEPAS